jgi:hypothetical protein
MRIGKPRARQPRMRHQPIGAVVGRERVLREGMQDVGEDQLLMLLLVIEADLEDAQHLRQARRRGGGDEPLHRFIDVGAERGDLVATRPREQPAPGARVTRSGRHVVRIEKIREAVVERAIAGETREQEKLLEEPGGMRPVPLGRARIGHRLHQLVLGAQRRGAALGLRAHGAEAVAPCRPSIARRGVGNGGATAFVGKATKDG